METSSLERYPEHRALRSECYLQPEIGVKMDKRKMD